MDRSRRWDCSSPPRVSLPSNPFINHCRDRYDDTHYHVPVAVKQPGTTHQTYDNRFVGCDSTHRLRTETGFLRCKITHTTERRQRLQRRAERTSPLLQLQPKKIRTKFTIQGSPYSEPIAQLRLQGTHKKVPTRARITFNPFFGSLYFERSPKEPTERCRALHNTNDTVIVEL